MNTHPDFPTEITPEEQKAGFRVVETRLPPPDSDPFCDHASTVVAVLDLAPSYRLIKMRDIKLSPTDNGVCYQLQIFGVDTHPMIQHPGEPQWQMIWDIPSGRMDLALKRYKTDKGNEFWKPATPPDVPTVKTS